MQLNHCLYRFITKLTVFGICPQLPFSDELNRGTLSEHHFQPSGSPLTSWKCKLHRR